MESLNQAAAKLGRLGQQFIITQTLVGFFQLIDLGDDLRSFVDVALVGVSAQDFDVLYGMEGMLAHTNNYLSRRMRAIEKDSNELIASRVRYNRAARLMRSQRGKLSVKSFQAILSDHVNYPQSICNHIDEDDSPL